MVIAAAILLTEADSSRVVFDMKRRANVEQLAATIPAWARVVSVRRFGELLVVVGKDRNKSGIVFQEDGKDSPLQHYRECRAATNVRVGEKRGSPPAHTRFANCRNDADLIQFVEDFGPIYGTAQDGPGEQAITVEQRMGPLRREQALFRDAVGLYSTLSAKWWDSSRIAVLLRSLAANSLMKELSVPALLAEAECKRLGIGYLIAHGSKVPRGDRSSVAFYGWSALCCLLGRFPPKLIPVARVSGAVAELPDYQREGILPVLYFMLHEDLKLGRAVKTCANPKCTRSFVIDGRNRECCSEECSKIVRDHRYYHVGAGRKRRQARYRRNRRIGGHQ